MPRKMAEISETDLQRAYELFERENAARRPPFPPSFRLYLSRLLSDHIRLLLDREDDPPPG